MERLILNIIEANDALRQYYVTYFKRQRIFFFVKGYDSLETFFVDHNDYPAPDMVLSDVRLPGADGIEGIRAIRQHYPAARVALLTDVQDSERIIRAFSAGAAGYMLKSTPLLSLREAVQAMLAGDSYMSPPVARKVVDYFAPRQDSSGLLSAKEKRIVRAIIDGLSYKMMSERLDISIDTVRYHIKNIYRKLSVDNKSQVVAMYFKGEVLLK